MIVDVVVEPTALLELSAGHLARGALPAQALFIETIKAHGAFLFSSEADLVELAMFASKSTQLNANERKRFSDLLLFMKERKRLILDAGLRVGYEQVIDAAILKSVPLGDDLVMVLGTEHFDRAFPDNEEGVATESGVSASLASTLTAVSSVMAKRTLAVTNKHPSGYSREAVWLELFAPIARHSRDVTIVDSYLFGEMAARKKGNRNAAQQEHVAWLLSKLASTAKLGTRVKLIGGYDELVPSDANEVMSMVLSQWKDEPRSIVELKVVMASRHDLPHGRHLRFGGLAFGLDEGFDRLRRPALWDVDGLNWKYLWSDAAINDLRERETRIERRPSASFAVRAL